MALTKIPSSLLDTTSGLSLSGDITLVDNDKAIFGAGSDLEIYHDGSNSYITDVGTGNLKIGGANVEITTAGGTKYFQGASNIARLYHTGNEKLATTSTGIDVTGNITVSGTVDGRDVATDGTKLDTIETNADVTDTTNVTAAGALMDSEITNLAQVKAFDSSDYATAAQGTTADSALQNIVEDTTPQLGGTLDTNNQLIQFGDSSGETVNRLQFGASQDLQIYHNGSHSNIRDVGSGNLYIDGSASINFRSGDAGETYAIFNDDGAVSLYYNNAVRLATSSTGIDVTGNLLLDSNNTEINLKGGGAGTTAKINWTFNTTGTDYATISLPYDTRATTGLHIDSGYPITIDATTRIDFDISGSTKMSMNTSGLNVTGAVTATSFSDGTISGITFIDEDSFATNSATRIPTQQSIKAYVDTQVASVVDSAPAALDTLNELAAALGDDANFSTTTSTALGNRLRVDTAAQGLTGTQQANAITNLGITATKAELNFVDGVTSNIQTQLDGKQASGSYLTGNQTITLSGDVSGSGTTSIAVTIADDSHNHVISNVDGLQTALNAKLASSSYTAADVLTKIKTVDGAGSGLDADLLDGISSASFLRSDANDTATGNITFNGDIYGRSVNAQYSRIYRMGGIFFTWDSDSYGTNLNHSITSTENGTYTDGITINSYGNVRINIDSNNNDTSTFSIGAGGTGTTGTLLTLDESGNLTITGTVDGRDVATDGTKLDGIAANANNYSFPYTVSADASNNTVVQRHSSGYIYANYFNGTGTFSTTGATSGMGIFTGTNGTDTFGRSYTAAAARTLLNVENGATADQTAAEILTAIKTVDGAGSGLDADLLDGLSEATFMRRSANSQLDMNNNDIVGVDQIIHEGDSNTYIQFHAADQWRVVTGGTERLEVNNTQVTVPGNMVVSGTLSVRAAIDLADNDILRFGSSDDVEFFCNGSHMYTDLNSGIGNWYIRDGTTTRFTFDDAGHFTATGNITAYSDERLKDNILVIDNALEKVSQLRGVTFNRTDTEEPHRQTGVIAQEVEKVLPEAVITADDEMQTKSVAYGNMVGLLIEAIKELKTEVNDLKKQLKEIK